MANVFDYEEYLKDLSPELQEKARECKTKDELMQLAADNDIEVPMDALEGVAGGCGGKCPKGGEHDWDIYNSYQECKKCGETRYFY